MISPGSSLERALRKDIEAVMLSPELRSFQEGSPEIRIGNITLPSEVKRAARETLLQLTPNKLANMLYDILKEEGKDDRTQLNTLLKLRQQYLEKTVFNQGIILESDAAEKQKLVSFAVIKALAEEDSLHLQPKIRVRDVVHAVFPSAAAALAPAEPERAQEPQRRARSVSRPPPEEPKPRSASVAPKPKGRPKGSGRGRGGY
jgi:hypothetical protein